MEKKIAVLRMDASVRVAWWEDGDLIMVEAVVPAETRIEPTKYGTMERVSRPPRARVVKMTREVFEARFMSVQKATALRIAEERAEKGLKAEAMQRGEKVVKESQVAEAHMMRFCQVIGGIDPAYMYAESTLRAKLRKVEAWIEERGWEALEAWLVQDGLALELAQEKVRHLRIAERKKYDEEFQDESCCAQYVMRSSDQFAESLCWGEPMTMRNSGEDVSAPMGAKGRLVDWAGVNENREMIRGIKVGR